MKPVVFIALILLHCFSGYSKNYYFSEKGNDNNDGTSKRTPWRSLTKLQAAVDLKSGDSILFERGSRFFGTLSIMGNGISAKEIYVGAYGVGSNPVIDGSVQINTWTRFEENIWVATCDSCKGSAGDLFINGGVQPVGRFPNEGYRTITRSLNSKVSFEDSALPFADNFWKGAEVVVKSSRWTLDKIRVFNFTNKTFRFLQSASDELKAGYGYFIQNHLATLDRDGEWFYNAETDQVFLYTDEDIRSNGTDIRLSTTDTGLRILNSSYVRVENLSITNTGALGVSISDSHHVVLNELEISHSGLNGLVVTGCKNISIENTDISDSNNNGVEWIDNEDGYFRHNTIVRTGLWAGRGESGNGTYIAMSISGGDTDGGRNVIEDNKIDSAGYIGIDFRAGNTYIKNNLINNFCLIKDDGGGIYTWKNPYGNNIIEGNIILNGIGSGEGTPDPTQLFTSGIYIDDFSSKVRIARNTVAFCATAGIYIHNANTIEISDNNLYGNGNNLLNSEKGQLLIKLDAIVPEFYRAPLDLKVTGNHFISIDESNYCIYLSAETKESLQSPGTFARNRYRSPKSKNTIAILYGANDMCDALETFELADWAVEGGDNGSSFARINVKYPKPAGKNLIKNSTINSNTDGWYIWPDGARVLYDKYFTPGPALKAEIIPGQEALLYHPGFILDNNKTYCLTFSAKGIRPGKLEFVPLSAKAPWNSLGRYSCFSLDTTLQTFTYFFKPDKSSAEARVNFKCNSSFWLDNVVLYEVTPHFNNSKESIRLIYNTTAEPQEIQLRETYADIEGNPVSGRLLLDAYGSIVLLRFH